MSSGISSSTHISEQTHFDPAAFVNWDEEPLELLSDVLPLCRSLISMVKAGHSIDDKLETKAELLLGNFWFSYREADADQSILGLVPSPTDDPLSEFVTSIIVLLPTDHKGLVTTMMDILKCLIQDCSSNIHLTLLKAALIPRLITHLNPLSLSFTDSQEIHSHLTSIISSSIWLATQFGLNKLKIENWNEQQTIHETVLQQVLIPAEPYIRHLCVHSSSIVDQDQSILFMRILGRLFRICPFHPPTLDLVQNLPVFMTIPNALSTFVFEASIWHILFEATTAQREWNEQGGGILQTGKTVLIYLRSEGFEDSMEQKLTTDKNGFWKRALERDSIALNNMLGTNLLADGDQGHDVPRALLGTLSLNSPRQSSECG
ncbi:hypothetical protein BLNAU_11054 [Blattamonas nauphoetae]|uniref:Uncharacterized protein n=1 Tax=Blattamonas nauphoetae TaxID=2049346 RepID=A0ABQ9XSG1_9EUKA|nr:hypothetical protein BLNAU_11054 [Blattamonas nauphoetae]